MIQISEKNKAFLFTLFEEKGKKIVDTIEEFKFIAAKVNTDRPISKKEYDLLMSVGNFEKNSMTVLQILHIVAATYGVYSFRSALELKQELIEKGVFDDKMKQLTNTLDEDTLNKYQELQIGGTTSNWLMLLGGFGLLLQSLVKHRLNKMLEKAKTLIKK